MTEHVGVVRDARHGRRRPGRRQERLARRDDRPTSPRCGVQRARRLRHHRATPTASSSRTTASPSASTRRSPTLDVDDVDALAATGAQIRDWILATPVPAGARSRTSPAWRRCDGRRPRDVAVAVRSSATAEDLPEALVRRPAGDLPQRARRDARAARPCTQVFASLFNDRAIAYRVHQGFDHTLVALSAGVQHMVRTDLGASGVMFTLDTESGFRDVVFITASWGLGETVVQGAVNPDEFYVYKPDAARRARSRSCAARSAARRSR
ncbi:MAG: hypothetical protein MZV65_17660 [Chromatiales bacterium]|nr:hypothetical protein [Chromatiales bacterium]